MNRETHLKRSPRQRKIEAQMVNCQLMELEFHCRRLHPKIMQVDGELAADGALIVRAITYVDWPPGSGPHRHTWQDAPLGPVRVWGTIKDGVFMTHGYGEEFFVKPPRPMKIRLIDLVLGKGRQAKGLNSHLIEDILHWMSGRLHQGASVEDLTQESYVLHRWSDRYGPENERLQGVYALVSKIQGQNPQRSVQSGVRLLRNHLKGLYTWHKLKQLASEKP
jgi:hypothetical protein